MPPKDSDAVMPGIRSVALGEGTSEETEILRFPLTFRIEHIILFSSLIILGISGLSLMFHDNWLAALIIKLEGGMQMRGLIHRTAAIVLLGVSLHHVLYVVFTEAGHKEFMKLQPHAKDFRDLWQTLKFDLGKTAQEPPFEKFNYIQKFQYGGVVVGLVIMMFTGFILWFETQSMAVMPKWLIDVTFVIHGYEGLLAFLVLFVWHMYIVHLNPTVFPMDRTWITGKISLKDLKEKHYLEYRELANKQQEHD